MFMDIDAFVYNIIWLFICLCIGIFIYCNINCFGY